MTDDPCLCTSLRQAAHLATDIYDRALEPSGLKITMYKVIKRLAEADKPTISELAKIVELDRSSLGRNLKILERDGLIAFADSDDGRAKIVKLTSQGKAALEKARPLWAKAQTKMRAALGTEKEAVFRILSRVSDSAHV